jgi:hypothetical protein
VGARPAVILLLNVSEQLLTILKLCLLALLYLFFFRVLRAVWAELRPPKLVDATPRSATGAAGGRRARKSAARRSDASAAGPRLVVVEPVDQRGRSFPMGAEMTVGLVEDLGSTNGTYLNRHKVAGPMVVHPGDKVQIGNTVMELA